MISETKEKQIYSVTELTKYIRQIIEDSFPAVWVEGEISNFLRHSSGHMYFSLKDAGSVVQCAMFKRSNEKLKFNLKDGMKVICFGKVSVYEPRGQYQLIVRAVIEDGVGRLQREFEALKRRLADEGKLIEAGWVGLRLAAIPLDAPAIQLEEMHNAFMAGAQHLFASIMNVLDPDAEPTEADMRRMDLIDRELRAFGEALKLRVAEAEGSG